MEIKMLDEKNHIDMESGCLCRYVRSDTEYFRPHYHNYYELFLVLKGNVCHMVNEKNQFLCEGELLFIRDFDVHDYKRADGEYFEFINMAFSKKMLEGLFCYLGKNFPFEKLIDAPYPPCVQLSPIEKEKLFFSLTELNGGAGKDVVNLKAKLILANVFLKYFYLHDKRKTEIPLWLEMTYEKMKDPKNFTAGMPRLCEISGKSREHTARSFKKYYLQSPTEFITNLRLNMAHNLLLTSNLSATDICYECGFENLSWFYKCFIKKFSKTPAQYRKEYL